MRRGARLSQHFYKRVQRKQFLPLQKDNKTVEAAMHKNSRQTRAKSDVVTVEQETSKFAPCPLKIIEVNALGHFIRIFNSSHHNLVDLSGYILWQLEGNYPVTMYRFPQNIFLPALRHITVSGIDCY
ncbi:Hypothetical predicted protein [Pelobates cultripes]|uniref:LTD domain-containing protein n=1 Tax=Pelobates cultripes TaxID=61616 RepID=A0AAD1WWM9_PELCU|nr:Hypothetical predicted protein [Pelobates cultripes]